MDVRVCLDSSGWMSTQLMTCFGGKANGGGGLRLACIFFSSSLYNFNDCNVSYTLKTKHTTKQEPRCLHETLPHVPDVREQEQQLGLPPRLLLSRAARLADVMYEGVRDGVQHTLHCRAVVDGLHRAGAEGEGT